MCPRGRTARAIAPAHARRRRRRHGVGLGEEPGELLAADPPEHLAARGRARSGGGDLDQGLVARAVAEAVVDALEVVEVEHGQRERTLVAAGALDLEQQPLVEDAVVGEPGQRVLRGARRELRARIGVRDGEADQVGEAGSRRSASSGSGRFEEATIAPHTARRGAPARRR